MLKKNKKLFYSQIFISYQKNSLFFLLENTTNINVLLKNGKAMSIYIIAKITKTIQILYQKVSSCLWSFILYCTRTVFCNIGGLGKFRRNFIKCVVPLWGVKNYWEVLKNGKGLKKIGQRYNCKLSSPFVTGIAVKNSQT